MAANVWMGILPATRKMLEAIRAGKPIEQKLAERAKGRTIHNTYMTVPLIFLMIKQPLSNGHLRREQQLADFVSAGSGRRVSAKFIYKA